MTEIPDIRSIQAWLGKAGPTCYVSFLESHDVDLEANDLVMLYGRESFIERNESCETKQYCPGYVTVGNDSGGREVLLSLADETLYLVDAGAMQIVDAHPLETTFAEWLDDGCPLPDEDAEFAGEVDPLTPVSVFLERKPSAVNQLLMIKRHLGISTGIGELKECVGKTPSRIATNFTYAKARLLCSRINDQEPCVGIRLADDESVHLPL